MTFADYTISTRHLVDPEAAPLLDGYQSFEITAASLPVVRERMNTPPPGAPDPADLYPGVTRTEHSIPGFDGGPDVGILLYEPAGRATPAPAMVWIHGGGFVIGSAAGEDLGTRRIAAQTGTVSVATSTADEVPT